MSSAAAGACIWQQITQSVQSCWPCSGDGALLAVRRVGGVADRDVAQRIAAAMAGGASGIVATTSTWHQAASHIIVKRMTDLIERQQ